MIYGILSIIKVLGIVIEYMHSYRLCYEVRSTTQQNDIRELMQIVLNITHNELFPEGVNKIEPYHRIGLENSIYIHIPYIILNVTHRYEIEHGNKTSASL